MADDGRYNSSYILALTFAERGDFAMAAECHRRAADEGSACAQHDLGCLYLEGKGVPNDPSRAAELFRKAAEQGLAPSQANLGLQYAEGIGLPKDDGQAVHWFRKAAEQGFADGLYKLGIMLCNGRGVAKDIVKGRELIHRAAQQGHPEAVQAMPGLDRAAVHEMVKESQGKGSSGCALLLAAALLGSMLAMVLGFLVGSA
jgi:TPR repeat protein